MNITIEQIKEHVDIRLGIDISKRSRKEEYTFGRSIFYTLCMKFCKTSYVKLANCVGVSAHRTVMHSVSETFTYAMTFPEYKTHYDKLERVMKGELFLQKNSAQLKVLEQENEMLKQELYRLKALLREQTRCLNNSIASIDNLIPCSH